MNKRNNQASITLPSKFLKNFEKNPNEVFVEISDTLLKKVKKDKSG